MRLSELCAMLPLVAVLVAGPPLGAQDRPDRPPRIRAQRVGKSTVERLVKLPGTLSPWEEVDVLARVSGYARAVNVDRGSTVRVGDVLLALDAPEVVADLESARFRVSEAEAETAKAEAEAALADLTAQRLATVRAASPEGVPAQALDEARARASIARRAVELARARARTVRSALARARAMADLLEVRAPLAGVITDRWVHPGAFVPMPGSSRAESARLVHLADTARLRLTVQVPEVESRWVQPGAPLRFTTDAVPGKRFEARIARFARALEPTSRVLTAEADVDNASGSLPAGAFARVELVAEVHPGATVVPPEALVQVRKVPHLAAIENGKVERRMVKVGVNTGTVVEILGLERDGTLTPVPEDQVVGLSISDSLTNGSSVTVELEVPAPAPSPASASKGAP